MWKPEREAHLVARRQQVRRGIRDAEAPGWASVTRSLLPAGPAMVNSAWWLPSARHPIENAGRFAGWTAQVRPRPAHWSAPSSARRRSRRRRPARRPGRRGSPRRSATSIRRPPPARTNGAESPARRTHRRTCAAQAGRPRPRRLALAGREHPRSSSTRRSETGISTSQSRAGRPREGGSRGGTRTRPAPATVAGACTVVAIVRVDPSGRPRAASWCGNGNASSRSARAPKSKIAARRRPSAVASWRSTLHRRGRKQAVDRQARRDRAEQLRVRVEVDLAPGDRETPSARAGSPTGRAAGSPSSSARAT